MRLPEPFYLADDHVWIDLPGARVLFTTRLGGFSSGPYASLNLGRLTGDDPATAQRNRDLLQDRLGIRFAYARQVHGARVMQVAGARDERAELPAADGQATATTGVAPMVLTADCLPIAIAAGGAVAMVHAGWRGLAQGVVAEGVKAVRALAGAAPMSAAIGPGAGVCCYRVGDEVQTAFAPQLRFALRGDRLDLKAIARYQLDQAGVRSVHDCGLCTICDGGSTFFSHRRDRGVTGRQAGITWLT